MGRKLYVGNLSFTATEDELRDYFAQAGTPESVAIIKDRMTGKSRGFGFVEMSNDNEAASAIELLDGKDFKGRPLKINEARGRESGGGGHDGGYSHGAGRH
jgi:RNA recognition motif-containing protein